MAKVQRHLKRQIHLYVRVCPMLQRIDMVQNRHNFLLEPSIFLHFMCLQGKHRDFICLLSSEFLTLGVRELGNKSQWTKPLP